MSTAAPANDAPFDTQQLNPVEVEVDWFDDSEIVRVTPRDQRRFDVQKDRAIKLLQLANYADTQLSLLLEKLGHWIRANADKVDIAYLTLRDDRFAFLAVSQKAECDEQLEDAISDLDFEVANDNDLNVIRMNAIVLPPASADGLRSFFDPRFLLVYRPQRVARD